jgi:cysteinyl-tRNA synthetase
MTAADIVLRDTLTGGPLPLEPLDDGHVRIYSCGPTVYGPAHVGNFRSFLFADVLVRYLRWRGLRVTWVMNLTDVDDKIIKGAAAAGVPFGDLTARWTERFLADAAALRMTIPDVVPRATDHIDEIVGLVERLEERGHAYRTPDGSIFFSIDSWPAYGRLARLDASQQRVGERVSADEYAKDDVRDFALWKAAKPGEPSWTTAIGEGRPGWHIECSAMSMRHLGESFDIHTGGIDLVFPHHEDEIAQSEAATGSTFVRTWLHCAHLVQGGTKMAKSRGNILRVADVLEAGVSPRALRYALIAVPYRTPLEFSDASLAAARAAVERLDALDASLAAYGGEAEDDPTIDALLDETRGRFDGALADDLNVSAALAALFDLVRDLNRRLASRALSRADADRARAFVRDLDRVLAVLPDEAGELDAELRSLLDERAAARRDRDWAASDRLRDALAELGIAVDDTSDGQRWRRIPVSPRAGG